MRNDRLSFFPFANASETLCPWSAVVFRPGVEYRVPKRAELPDVAPACSWSKPG